MKSRIIQPDPDTKTTTPTPRHLAARVGRWSVRHWKTATFGWLAFVVAAFMIGNAVKTKTLDPAKSGNGESGHVQAVLADEWKQPKGEALIIQSKHGSSHDASFRATVNGVIDRIEGMPQVKKVDSPFAPGHERMQSKDGRTVLVPFELHDTDLAKAQKSVVPVQDAVTAYANAHPSVTIDEFGDASSETEIQGAITKDLGKAGMLSLPVTLAVLLLTFGALIVAGLPVLLGLTAVFATMGLLALPSHLIPLDSQVNVIVLLIGLAVGVDYAMFYVKRAKEEREAGRGARAAVEAAAATSGRAVLISGLTVIIAMAGMLFTGDKAFTGFGIAAMTVVAAAVLGSLTVLPALLARLGDKVDRLRVPFLHRFQRPAGKGRVWDAILTRVLKRPLVSAVISGSILLALAVPAVQMHGANPSAEMFPPNLKTTQAFKKMEAAYPSGSAVIPAQVMVKTDDVSAPSAAKAINDLRNQAIASGHFKTPTEIETNPQKTIALVTLPIAGSGTDATSKAALASLRTKIIPTTVGKIQGADIGVIGGTAADDDFAKQMKKSAPYVFAFVLGFAFLLLLVTFRSIVVAAKAVILNLLSVAAAYGVLVMVFQWGWGKNLLGFEYTGGIFGFLPIFLFVILFGLSMDYHVFILSRVREAFDRGMSSDDAVAHGIKSTAGVVTSAATVMVGVFAIFASLQFIFLKQFGVGLAAAILIDATIVRAVLLPATMKLLGDRNWYLPRWLQWLPKLDHEAPVERPRPVATTTPAYEQAA
jgi:RND superfamily putative drug exporter